MSLRRKSFYFRINVAVLTLFVLTFLYCEYFKWTPRILCLVEEDETFHSKPKLLELVENDVTFPRNVFPGVWINHTGTLQSRILAMHEYLNKFREMLLNMRNEYYNDTWNPLKEPFRLIDGVNVNYLRELATSGEVIPLVLPWRVQNGGTKEHPLHTLTDTTNLFIQKYYQWTAEPELCEWINSGKTNMQYHVVHESKCVSDKSLHKTATSLLLITLTSRPANKEIFPTFPPFYYTDLPKYGMHIMIATNAIFTNDGNLITGKLKYVPYTCFHDQNSKCDVSYEYSKLYNEVFSISQYWGDGIFHQNVESFPRIAPFLPWLRANPKIKIHVYKTPGYCSNYDLLKHLGIDEDRIISGHVRAKIAYMPESTACGFNLVAQTQLLSSEYHKIIHNKFNQNKRNSIVLIRRSKWRRLTKHVEVEAMLKEVAEEYQLELELFIDNPSPPIEGAMRMFNRAVMVVAPHGAGLYNILFSEPETFVIEAVCNRPHVNLCYQRLAYTLGHHYHAIPSKHGCEESINIDMEDMKNALKEYIPNAAKLRKI